MANPGFLYATTSATAAANSISVPEPTTDGTSSILSGDRHLMAGDDVFVMLSVQAARSTSMPSGWTRLTSATGIYAGFKAELWHYGISPTSTWSSLNATMTLGAGTSFTSTMISLAVRGTYIDQMSWTTYTPTANLAGPPVTYTGNNAYSVGWVIGSNYSTSGQGQPQMNPSTGGDNGPQNGWVGLNTNGPNEPGHKLVVNKTVDSPTAPTFRNVATTLLWSYFYFSISKVASSGWSVGRIKY